MYKVYILLILLLIGTSPITSQTSMEDSLKAAFHYKPKPYGDFGGRNSFVQNSRADIWGIKLGISFHRRVRIGAGYNYMSSDLTKPLLYTDAARANQITLEHMKMRYASVYFEYVYFRNKRWEFSIPLQLGAGFSKYVYSIGNVSYERDRQFILLYEPMVQTKYYIFPWLGAEVDVGIRLMAKENSAIGINLNSPMYAFGLFMAWDELYKTLFPHTALTRKL